MPRSIAILIVDDNPEDRFVYRRLLNRVEDHPYDIREADRVATAIEMLDTGYTPDCILLDYNLPDGTGVELLDDLIGEGATPSLAIVMLTGQGNEVVAVESMKRGAQDYLIKDSLTPESLAFSIDNAIERVSLRRELDRHRLDLIRSNKDLERFAGVVAHDLKNPLASLHALLQSVDAENEPGLSAKKRGYVLESIRAARRMSDLIDDLLAFSRIGGTEREVRDVDLNRSLAAVLESLTALILERNALIEPDDLPTVRGDRSQLAIVLQNLVGNAIKFCTEHRPHVRITSTEHKKRWTIRIEDNGPGIDAANHEEVFGAFTRLHRQDEVPGTGLGLAICKRVLDQHGGRIGIESAKGSGTTIWFDLPKT